MKKFITPIFMMMSILVMTLTSCEDQSVKELKTVINKVQSECPMNMGMLGDVLDVKYLDDSHEVKIYYNINEEFIDIDAFNKNQELVQNNLKLAFATGDSRKLSEMIVKANAGLKVVYKNASSGRTCEVACSSEELKEMLARPLSETEIYEMIITNQVSMENARCPYAVEEGLMMQKVVDENGFIVYYADIDEDLYDISQLKHPEVMREMRSSVEEYFSEPMLERFITLLTSVNKGVIYRYVGNKSGETIDIVFTVDDLKTVGSNTTLDIL